MRDENTLRKKLHDRDRIWTPHWHRILWESSTGFWLSLVRAIRYDASLNTSLLCSNVSNPGLQSSIHNLILGLFFIKWGKHLALGLLMLHYDCQLLFTLVPLSFVHNGQQRLLKLNRLWGTAELAANFHSVCYWRGLISQLPICHTI